MARIPQYSGGNVQPIVRPGPRVTGAPSPAAAALPGRQLQGLSEGIANVGNVIGDYAAKEQEKINKVRFNDAYNQALNEANRLKNEMAQYQGAEANKGINGRSLTDHYRDELQKAFSKIGEGLSAPDVRDGFQLAADDLSAKFLREADTYFVEQGRVYSDNVRDATVLSSFDAIAAIQPQMKTAKTPEELFRLKEAQTASLSRAKDALKDKFMDAGYDGEALDQQVKTALAKAHNAVLSGMLEQDDLAGAKAYFETHKGDYLELDAQAVPAMFAQTEAELRRKNYERMSLGIVKDEIGVEELASAHSAGEIDDGEYVTLLGQAAQMAARKEAEQKARVSEWRDRNFASLQVGITDGTMTRADADRMYQRGEITPQQWSQAARMGETVSASNKAMGEFVDYLSTGMPIDPSNPAMKKGADEYFRQAGGMEMFQTDFPKAMEMVSTFARDAGIIPSSAVSVLRGMRSGGTEQQQIGAIKAMADLYALQPNAAEAAFTDIELAEGLSLAFKMDAGIPPMQAYQAIIKEREAAADPNGVPAALKAEGRKTATKAGQALAVLNRLGGGVAGGGLAEQQMIRAYETAYQNFFIQHGDESLAKQQADAVIGRTYGPSVANGGKTMMHPPEKYYPAAGDWLRDSLVSGVSELMGTKVEAGDIELVSDALTTRAIQNTGKPVYTVVVKTNGVMDAIGVWTYDEEAAKEIEKQAKFNRAWAEAGGSIAGTAKKQEARTEKVKALERMVEVQGRQLEILENSGKTGPTYRRELELNREAYKNAQADLKEAKRQAGMD
jgi:hypothetical protein